MERKISERYEEELDEWLRSNKKVKINEGQHDDDVMVEDNLVVQREDIG